MYPDKRVSDLINNSFIPVKIHIKEQPASFHRFEANWTPTIEILDSEGKERYRFEGYLPQDYFLAQLEIGLGKTAFAHKDWAEAQRHFDNVVTSYPDTDKAAEAMYWAGVSRYKATNNHEILGGTAQQISSSYPHTSWALRSSVWLPSKESAA